MKTETLVPDAPAVLVEGGRRYVEVPWDGADVLRDALAKHGYSTTLCLDPENRQARLELWPGVTAEAVQAVLEARQPVRHPGLATPAPTTVPDREKTSVPSTDPADLICI